MFGLFRGKPKGLLGGEASPVQGAFGIGGKIMPEAQPAPKQGIGSKLFGNGWEDKAFALGGILQGDGGAAWESVQQRRQAPLIEQAKREAEYRDWVRKQQWERDNKPKDPYRWRNNNGDLMEIGADGQPRVAYDDPTDKMDWIQVRDPLTGEIRIIPQPRGQQSAPDVLPADFFDDGGPSQPATGRFP